MPKSRPMPTLTPKATAMEEVVTTVDQPAADAMT
jgi:hypothetical protein